MNKSLPAALLLGVSLFAGWLFVTGRTEQAPTSRIAPPGTVAADAVVGEAAGDSRGTRRDARRASTDATPSPSRLAASLRGTDVDGGLLVDASGNFVATADAIAMFDYFFSALGEADEKAIVQRIRAEIAERLDPPADAQALEFLERYLNYRERGRALGAPDPVAGDLRVSLEKLKALRREIFGEEVAERIFGEGEQVADFSIRQREIASDPALGDADKAARMDALMDEMPEPMREQRRQVQAATQLREDEARIRADGGDADDIRRLRVERFGEEAADRLDELDRSDAEWDRRVSDFRDARQRVLATPGLSDAQKQQSIDSLAAGRFDEAERIRLDTQNRIAEQHR